MKSVELQFNEALQGLNPVQRSLFNKHRQPKTTCEVQLNLIEAIVRGEVKETTPIKKNNGKGDLFVEGNPFFEHYAGGEVITETDKTVAKKESLVESVCKTNNCDEAGARVILGLKPKAPQGLTKLQEAEYTFAIKCGFSESDAMKLAKLPLTQDNTNPHYTR